MNTALVFLMVASLIAVVILFSVMPIVDSSITATGAALSNATGYEGESQHSEAAISELWAVAPVLIILSLFVMVLAER